MLIVNLFALCFISIIITSKDIHFFCDSCKSLENHLDETERWDFYALNGFHDKWFIIFHKKTNKITLFPVFI